MREWIKKHWGRLLGGGLALFLLGILAWVTVVTYQADRMGFSGKTYWDWMELLLIPVGLAVAGFIYSYFQKQTELEIAEKQRDEEREIAKQERETDREIALERHLRTSNEGDEVRSIARTRTLAVLRSLDGERKGQVIKFLYESNLIMHPNPIVDLQFADLTETNLEYAHLVGVSLPKVNLRDANLQSAKLMDSNFYLSDFDRANLSWADLSRSMLCCAFKDAQLGCAKLNDAHLRSADFCGANLTNAHLNRADLSNANLKYKNANIELEVLFPDENNIKKANLVLASLEGAILTNAKVDLEQLKSTRSLISATMPDGSKYEDWIKTIKQELELTKEESSSPIEVEKMRKNLNHVKEETLVEDESKNKVIEAKRKNP